MDYSVILLEAKKLFFMIITNGEEIYLLLSTYYKALPLRHVSGLAPPRRFQTSPSLVYLTSSQVFKEFNK